MRITQKIQMVLRMAVLSGAVGAAASSEAQVTNLLYNPTTNGLRTSYLAAVGCEFQVGSSNVIISHLGYFGMDTNNGLSIAHPVGVMTSILSAPALLGGVTVPAGAGSYWASNYFWVQLDPPLLLSSNTQYCVAGVPEQNGVDLWPDAFTPTWNTSIVGTSATTTRHALYAPNNAGGTQIPPSSFSQNGNNTTYGDASLANIPIGPAKCTVQLTSVTYSAGQSVFVAGGASGQGPLTNQWWEVASPTNILISTTANPYANLVIPNSTTNTSGTYYLTASNALGGEQSSNVTVVITSIPVSVTHQPTNLTVFQNYSATFTVSATGSPPITYQWMRNGVAIPGATATNYTLASPSITNNGDAYSCVASNFTSGTPYTAASSNAVLTVIYNLAQPQMFLHGFKSGLANNTYGGQQGGQFITGNSPVPVTHLGFYAWPGNTTTNGTNISCVLTNTAHHIGLYSATGTTLLGSVLVPQGTNAVINGYMWQPLDPPLTLATNTQYLLVAETTTAGDPWGDTYAVPDLNSSIAASCDAIYGGTAWGGTPFLGGAYSGQMYSAPNLASLALPTLSAYALPESGVELYAGFSTNFTAVVEGQAPVTLQWYEEPNVLLPNQTNLTLNFPNLAVSNSGSYYVIATNPVTGASAQSADLVLTVDADVAPFIVQDIAPTSPEIVQGSSVTFSAFFNGSPTYTYGWQLNGNPVANSSRISGANGNVLTINDVQGGDVGTYQLFATNSVGPGQSSQAMLTIVPILPFNGGAGWSYQGKTVAWADTNILQMTSGISSDSNSAFCSSPLYIGGFEASFAYQVINPFGTLADGLTFCIQNDARGAAALGYDGGSLGVSGASSTPGPASSLAIYPSVEFEMDIFADSGVGVVAFATNGGIGPYGPTTNGTTPALIIDNGDVISNFVTYDGTTLSVTMTDVTVGSTNYGATFVTNTLINIASVLGTNTAYVGFTAGDGASSSEQQISNFSFVSLLPISAQASSGNLLLSWPDASGAYMLEQSPVLGAGANWMPVATAPSYVNGQNQVSLPISAGPAYYQLVLTNVPSL